MRFLVDAEMCSIFGEIRKTNLVKFERPLEFLYPVLQIEGFGEMNRISLLNFVTCLALIMLVTMKITQPWLCRWY